MDGNKKKTIGIILFLFGLITAFSLFWLSYPLAMSDHYEAMTWCLIAAPICGVLAIVGIILFFIGVSEGKKKKNLNL